MFQWTGTNRVFGADSYFASEKAVVDFKKLGMKYIGFVKTATKDVPIYYFRHIEFEILGYCRSFPLNNDTDDGNEVLVFVWMKQERGYFVATDLSIN